MGNILRVPSGRSLVLTHRSASTSMARCAIDCYWPGIEISDNQHLAVFIPDQDYYNGEQKNVCLIVRNPIDRFLSMVKHKIQYGIEYWLSRPPAPLPDGNFDKYFLFESELNDCAQWLGFRKSLPTLNVSNGPTIVLSSKELEKVNEIYKKDIELWKSLQE